MEPKKVLEQLHRAIEQGVKLITLQGLEGSARSFFISEMLKGLSRPCLILTSSEKEASRLSDQLGFFMAQDPDSYSTPRRIFQFPAYDISPLCGLSPHQEIIARRLEALYQLIYHPAPITVTSLDAVAFRILPKKEFLDSVELLQRGEEFDRDKLVVYLEAAGYNRSPLVEERGDYAARGAILDLFPPLHQFPIRIEFWGDLIESIRYFDPSNQRSLQELSEFVLIPCSEVITKENNIQRARTMGRLPNAGAEVFRFPGIEAWLNHFYDHPATLFDYVPRDTIVIVDTPQGLRPHHETIESRHVRAIEQYRKEASRKGRPFPETSNSIVPIDDLIDLLKTYQRVHLGPWKADCDEQAALLLSIEPVAPVDYELDLVIEGKGRVSMAPLAQRVSQWADSGGCVVLVTRTLRQAQRLLQILNNYGVSIAQIVTSWTDIGRKKGLFLCVGKLTRGFLWPQMALFVVTEDEIFGPKRSAPRVQRGRPPAAPRWSSISQLTEGDLVVHEDHGIGQYGGLFKMEIAGKESDFLLINYAEGDKLYIPADRIGILQKYVGPEDKEPKLDRLGGRSWNIAKQRAKRSIKQIAKQLVDLYALRTHKTGYAFSPPDTVFKEFEATFEHEETPDQIKAIEEVIKDMTSERPMDRLICGDVGFGKTEVALRAAFKAVGDGKQVAMLVPTTVLAEQHYDTFVKRMGPYGIRIGLLSRFKSKKEQAEILARLRSGAIDIIIGTHRLLQRDVAFSNLGLVIIDEEQRFGVKQKEALKRYRALVDVLALTATPIPRTLQLSMTGIRDLSIIETPPQDRLSVQTTVSAYDEDLIVRAIQMEMERGGQVFYVHNKVQTIDNCAENLRNLVPFARISVAHGQMRERDLEQTMLQFLRKEIDVLVCSTIIESGLDIPSANTIIITEVERLGLAQIYQLRGRVGRSKEKAYAYLLFSNGASMTKDAEKRIKALMDFSHLGAGLQLAMHDLKIRGGGNILGFAQSGHITAVGYELYLKLVEQAVAELKGEQWHEEPDPEINIPVPARLPERYIGDMNVRLNLYRRLSTIRQEQDLERMAEEVRDRFGPPPHEVENLFQLVRLRLILKRLKVSKLDVGRTGISLTFSPASDLDPEKIVNVVSENPSKVRFMSSSRLHIVVPRVGSERLLARIVEMIRWFERALGQT